MAWIRLRRYAPAADVITVQNIRSVYHLRSYLYSAGKAVTRRLQPWLLPWRLNPGAKATTILSAFMLRLGPEHRAML